jgi:AraC-like DNA-binding protein
VVHLSPKYLSRLFKQEAKVGFNQFRLGVKMEKAKELLKSSDYNVSQISYKIGYQNVESFIRCFKNATNCTPSQYRKKTYSKQKIKK